MAMGTHRHDLPARPPSRDPVHLHPGLDLPPAPPPADLPPMYEFRGDSWRPGRRPEERYEQNDFSFRQNNERSLQYPDGGAHSSTSIWSSGRNPHPERRPYQNGTVRDRYANASESRYGRAGSRYGRGRGRGRGFPATAERPLLRSTRGSTPEQMTGMTLEQQHNTRFMVPEDISDSEEKEMEESEPEDVNETNQISSSAVLSSDMINANPSDDATEPVRKKQIREFAEREPALASPVPKWSNPDPYTVLPPPDETQKKRKDVVKLIRKARIATEQELVPNNALVANDDFISLNFENEADLMSDTEESDKEPKGVPGAPSGPRQFSHLSALHGPSQTTAPGTTAGAGSGASLQPPPGYSATPLVNGTKVADDVWPPPDKEAALGNRKRTHDDTIKTDAPPRPKKKKGGKVPPADGSIIEEWKASGTSRDVPWCVTNYAKVENVGFGFHMEICDFYDFVRPREYEDVIRNELLQRLRYTIRKEYDHCDVRSFGSFAAGLYLPNADMDLVVVSDAFMARGRKFTCQTKYQMRYFADFLKYEQVPEPGSVEVIFGAKVPLIKFVDRVTGLRVDLSFENDTGIIANRTFASWKAQFPAMPIIVTLIKQFLMMRGLNEVVNGGLGGFSVTCLVTSLLQNMPEVQRGTLIPEQHLGFILMEFFNLYGNEFNTITTGIRMTPPYYFDKRKVQGRPYQANKLERLAIIDPNRDDNDISGGTRNILNILEHFAEAHRALQQRMASLNQAEFENQRTESILGVILAGDYSSFEKQRNRLRRLYEERFGKYDGERLRGISEENAVAAQIPHNIIGSTLNQAVDMGRKKNPTSGSSTTKAKSEPQSKPANTGDLSRLDKKKLSNPVTNEEAARRRATVFKKDFPDIRNIPKTISKKERKRMIAEYNATLVVP